VVVGVERTVSRREKDAIGFPVIDDSRTRPYSRSPGAAIRGLGRSFQVHGLVAAVRVEYLRAAVREVDDRQVPLIVAPISGVPRVSDVEVGDPAGARSDGQGRGTLFVVGFQRCERRPAERAKPLPRPRHGICARSRRAIAVYEATVRIDRGDEVE